MPGFVELGVCYVNDALQGMAYLDDRLYTVDASNSQISVYYCISSKISQDSVGIQYLYPAKDEDIVIEELIYADYMEACSITSSLFVCDSGSACIFKVYAKSKQVEKLHFGPNEKVIHLSSSKGKLVVPIFVQDGVNFIEIYSTNSLEKLLRLELQAALWVHRVIFKSNGNLLLCWTKDVRGQMAMLSEMEFGPEEKDMKIMRSTDLGLFKYEFDLLELNNGYILLSDTCDNSVTMFSTDLKTSEKVSCPEGLLKILQPNLMTICSNSETSNVIFLSQMTPCRVAEEQHHVEHSKQFRHIIRILKII